MPDIPDDLPVDEDVFLELPNIYGYEPDDSELEHISPILRHLAFPVDELQRDPENAKSHGKENREVVQHSIRKYGQRDLIVVRADDRVIEAGNLRHKVVSEDLGHNWIAVSFEDDDPLTATTFALVDNRSAELAQWNEKLQPVLDSLFNEYDFDIGKLGFEEHTFDDIERDVDFDFNDISDEEGSEDDEDEGSKYTDKLESPTYEPTGEKPHVTELYDREKTEELLDELDELDDTEIPAPVEQFLRFAAERHTEFYFDQIAEYYAQAPPEVQRLMEHSALVVIDFDQAIEQGFVHMSKRVLDIVEDVDEFDRAEVDK